MNRDDESLRELKETQARLKELYLSSRGRWTWRATGASCGLAGGMLAATLGTLLMTCAWALGDETGVLSMHGVGSILLLSTIPLLIAGAHCLDLLERGMKGSVRVNSGGAQKAARLIRGVS
jgi:hypothetical protein